MGRLGADAGRAAGARDRRGRGRRLRAARRAGDAEDAHRLVRQRDATRCAWRAPPKRPASRWSRCTAARASRATAGMAEYDTIAAVKAAVRIPVVANGDIDSPREGARGARRHRRRCAHDRPRRAGPAVDLPRDRALPRDRRARWRRRCVAEVRRLAARAPAATTTRCTASSPACAARASTSAGPCAACPAARRSARAMNAIETCEAQIAAVADWFDALADRAPRCRPRRAPTARAIH